MFLFDALSKNETYFLAFPHIIPASQILSKKTQPPDSNKKSPKRAFAERPLPPSEISHNGND